MSLIRLRAEDPYDKDEEDLETTATDNAFKLLQCTDVGLNTAKAIRRLELFGPSESEKYDVPLRVRCSICVLVVFLMPATFFGWNIKIMTTFFSSSASCGILFTGL